MLYITLLRGINVGGKNLISMAKLQTIFEDLNYKNVEIVGNTGIVIFSAEKVVVDLLLATKLSIILQAEIKLIVLKFSELELLMTNLPDWWTQNKEWRHNAFFCRRLFSCNFYGITSNT